ncbi:Uu.00g056090.m01.CDS01 [Anthostomella pinea]|uniref:Uu.00g056090.m01.CDS01 n=1 Tax=Anthostomella pinea TaxID=933095 RepID=A0AAI8YM29_9PEZI|nr:Uu.00g056090.m01.CDS01 [Anthostomella pinea]
MGRWSHYDTDEERLPEGMQRIGYDADDQTYTFRDADGSIWESAPGSQYGQLRRVTTTLPSYGDDEDDGADPSRPLNSINMNADPPASWRQEMMPLLNWLLLVGLFLLFVFWFIGGTSSNKPETALCNDKSTSYTIKAGDTCWAIAEGRHVPLEALVQENEGLDCDSLVAGQSICVPEV